VKRGGAATGDVHSPSSTAGMAGWDVGGAGGLDGKASKTAGIYQLRDAANNSGACCEAHPLIPRC
jgi:hypothetical protein